MDREDLLKRIELRKVSLSAEVDGGSYFAILENNSGNFYPTIRLRRSDWRKLMELYEVIPGRKSFNKLADGRIVYWLNYQGAKAYELIDYFGNLLKEKKPQAEILLEFRDHVGRYRKANGFYGKLTDEERQARRRFAERIQELNNKVPDVDIDQEGNNFLNPRPVEPSADEPIENIFD